MDAAAASVSQAGTLHPLPVDAIGSLVRQALTALAAASTMASDFDGRHHLTTRLHDAVAAALAKVGGRAPAGVPPPLAICMWRLPN